MKPNILLLFLIGSVMCQAQTKLIAHKSHSGSKHTFSKAYKNQLFDINRSNFGLPGNRNVLVLDTIIAINDSVTVLKIRESKVCYPFGTSYQDLKKADFKHKSDTLVNHELLYKKNTVAKIKSTGFYKYPFRFTNPLEEVVFIGFKE